MSSSGISQVVLARDYCDLVRVNYFENIQGPVFGVTLFSRYCEREYVLSWTKNSAAYRSRHPRFHFCEEKCLSLHLFSVCSKACSHFMICRDHLAVRRYQHLKMHRYTFITHCTSMCINSANKSATWRILKVLIWEHYGRIMEHGHTCTMISTPSSMEHRSRAAMLSVLMSISTVYMNCNTVRRVAVSKSVTLIRIISVAAYLGRGERRVWVSVGGRLHRRRQWHYHLYVLSDHIRQESKTILDDVKEWEGWARMRFKGAWGPSSPSIVLPPMDWIIFMSMRKSQGGSAHDHHQPAKLLGERGAVGSERDLVRLQCPVWRHEDHVTQLVLAPERVHDVEHLAGGGAIHRVLAAARLGVGLE